MILPPFCQKAKFERKHSPEMSYRCLVIVDTYDVYFKKFLGKIFGF